MYDARSKRFMAEDLVKGSVLVPMTMPSYAYCLGNPLVYVDPDGMVPRLQDVFAPRFPWGATGGAVENAQLISSWLEEQIKENRDAVLIGLVDTVPRGNNVLTGATAALFFPTFDVAHATLISNRSMDRGEAFARENNLFNNGQLITWDNEADAYRHFYWTFNMSRDISFEISRFIGNTHEITGMLSSGTLISSFFDFTDRGHVEAYFGLPEIMDLWNNSVGRRAGVNPANANRTYREIFDCFMNSNNNPLILSTDEVLERLGIDNNYLTGPGGTIRGTWNANSDIIRFNGLQGRSIRLNLNTNTVTSYRQDWRE